MFDHHDRRIRHVDADFDDCGGDQHADFAVLEGGHHRVLFRTCHAAMHEADIFRAEFSRKDCVTFFRRHQFGDVGFFDQRADPIGLPALGYGAF
ncbi:hypothetical protein D3C73_762500 [compost metagenome]